MLNKRAFKLLANRELISEAQLRLVCSIFSASPMHRFTSIDVTTLKRVFGANHNSASRMRRQLRELVNMGLFLRGPRVAGAYTYRVNPQYMQNFLTASKYLQKLKAETERAALAPVGIASVEIPLHNPDTQRKWPPFFRKASDSAAATKSEDVDSQIAR